MPPSRQFWSILKWILWAMLFALLGAAAVCYLVLEGWRQLFFTGVSIALAVNVLLMLIFVRANDRKRPQR